MCMHEYQKDKFVFPSSGHPFLNLRSIPVNNYVVQGYIIIILDTILIFELQLSLSLPDNHPACHNAFVSTTLYRLWPSHLQFHQFRLTFIFDISTQLSTQQETPLKIKMCVCVHVYKHITSYFSPLKLKDYIQHYKILVTIMSSYIIS